MPGFGKKATGRGLGDIIRVNDPQRDAPAPIRITEPPLDVPPGLDFPAPTAEALAERFAEVEARARRWERRARDTEEEADRARRDWLLRAVETLDLLEDAIASFGAPDDADPPAREARERLCLVADRFRTDLLERFDVREVPVSPGDPVDPARDQVLETLAPEGLTEGSIVEVVRRAWYDENRKAFLRKAVVKVSGART